ncbi:MAG: argininosuccinate lyase [Aquificota bacterium]|nr:argininosuccinate lyase [Aquificota bacterium]
MEKPWSGRFSEDTDRFVEEFTESVSFDKLLAEEDIKQNIAHVRTLLRAGVLTEEEVEKIIKALERIRKDIDEGKFTWRKELEDVHMNIEAELIRRTGDTGGKVHTGRSRNDQIATDERIFLKKEIAEIVDLLKDLRRVLVRTAERTVDIVIPSYTHLQRAQPLRLAHYFLAFREMFLKDSERFLDCYRRVDELPLGSGAVAGVDFPLDRFFTARELGFSKVVRNSMYATADRDFILEVLFCCAVTGTHLSRFAEDMILWSSEEFSYVELPDRLCTGSSIMPQKKNPDILELIRGKTGRLYGNLMSLLTVLKGLPTAYNRDLQEDKEPLFDSLRTLKGSIAGMTKAVEGMKFNEDRMKTSSGNLTLATDLANYLVRKGVPFREAHRTAGRIVAYVTETGKRIEDLTLEELRRFSDLFSEDALDLLTPEGSADRKNTYGGTSREQILRMIEVAKREEGL